MGNGRRRGILTIGAVDKAVEGVEVGDLALIRAIEGGGTLFGNEATLRGSKGSRLGGGLFRVGIGMSGRTVRLYMTSPVSQDTLRSRSVFLLTDGESGPADLLRGSEGVELHGSPQAAKQWAPFGQLSPLPAWGMTVGKS